MENKPSEIINGTIVRGYIMRYCKATEWNANLIKLSPGTDISDSDAVAYYIKQSDGKYHEYYGYDVPKNTEIFANVDE